MTRAEQWAQAALALAWGFNAYGDVRRGEWGWFAVSVGFVLFIAAPLFAHREKA